MAVLYRLAYTNKTCCYEQFVIVKHQCNKILHRVFYMLHTNYGNGNYGYMDFFC